jgi:small subunit ribosomal protein S16
VGSKKNPIWRVVVADQRSPRDGRFIETIGHYNPQTNPSTIRIDEERLQHWLARGAQPTGTVRQLVKAYSKGGGAAAAEADAVVDAPDSAATSASAAPGDPAPGAAEEIDAEPSGTPPEPPDPAADADDAADAAEGEAPENPDSA